LDHLGSALNSAKLVSSLRPPLRAPRPLFAAAKTSEVDAFLSSRLQLSGPGLARVSHVLKDNESDDPEEWESIVGVLETSLNMPAPEVGKLVARIPEVLCMTTAEDLAKDLAVWKTTCGLASERELSSLVALEPAVLLMESDDVLATMSYLEEEAGFTEMQRRNIALTSPLFFSLDLTAELKPVFMAVYAEDQTQADLVAEAFPNIRPEVLDIIDRALEAAFGEDDELDLIIGGGDEDEGA